MAVIDDLRKLAELDVVYLTRTFSGGGGAPYELFRGRLRLALDGGWVFNAFFGQNGVMGMGLGSPTPGSSNAWTSNESPAGGIVVSILYPSSGPWFEQIVLTSVLPTEFAE